MARVEVDLDPSALDAEVEAAHQTATKRAIGGAKQDAPRASGRGAAGIHAKAHTPLKAEARAREQDRHMYVRNVVDRHNQFLDESQDVFMDAFINELRRRLK